MPITLHHQLKIWSVECPCKCKHSQKCLRQPLTTVSEYWVCQTIVCRSTGSLLYTEKNILKLLTINNITAIIQNNLHHCNITTNHPPFKITWITVPLGLSSPSPGEVTLNHWINGSKSDIVLHSNVTVVLTNAVTLFGCESLIYGLCG